MPTPISERIKTKYPRLLHEMQWAAHLSESEAVSALLAHEQGQTYGCEAVDHFGGVREVLLAAWMLRRQPAARRVSRGRALLDRVFRNGDQPLDFDWRGRVRVAMMGYNFDLLRHDACVLAWSFNHTFTTALSQLTIASGDERLRNDRNGECFYGFDCYCGTGGMTEEAGEQEAINLTRAWETVAGVVG